MKAATITTLAMTTKITDELILYHDRFSRIVGDTAGVALILVDHIGATGGTLIAPRTVDSNRNDQYSPNVKQVELFHSFVAEP
jgi:hypothetical protein